MPSFAEIPFFDLAHPTPWGFVIFALSLSFLFLLTIKLLARVPSIRSHRSSLPLPPGPKGLPILGNFFDLPAEYPWLKAAELAEEYGEIVHVNAVGQHLIYLNTFEVASDLLELRSSKYSDRVVSEMTKLSGADNFVSRMPYGEKWRTSRRMFHQEFNSNTAAKFFDIQSRRCRYTLLYPSQLRAIFADVV